MRGVLGAALVAATSSLSAAEPAQVTLTYASAADVASACPDEPTFRGLVSARLGYDPFTLGATTKLRVSFRATGAIVVGELTLTGPNGEALGARTMRAPAEECLELATSMALAVGVAIDPEAIGKNPAPAVTPEPAPPPPAPIVVPPPRIASPPPVPIADVAHRARLRIELGGIAAGGVVPAPSGGARFGAALEGTSLSIGAETALVLPGSEDSAFGSVTAYAVYGSLVPCAHLHASASSRIDLCVVGSVGALRADARGVDRATPTTDLLATIGPRAGVTVMPWERIGFAAAFDVPVSLSRVTLAIEDSGVRQEVWTSALVGWAVRFSAILRFDRT